MTYRKRKFPYILAFLVATACCSLLWAIAVPEGNSRYGRTETIAEIDEPSVVEQPMVSPSPITPPPDTGLRSPIPSYDNNPLDEDQFYYSTLPPTLTVFKT